MSTAVVGDLRIRRQSLHDVVVDRLRDLIVEGVLAPGQRLNERLLCERLGVSRTPLRESFKVLASEGLIEILPNRGATVAPLTIEELKEVVDVLSGLEAVVGPLAASGSMPPRAEARSAAPGRCSSITGRATCPAYFRLNQEIHLRLVEATGNRTLLDTYTALGLPATARRRRRHAHRPGCRPMSASRSPVLMLGGTGTLGSRTARVLRMLQPDLPLAIAARDQGRARNFARSLGHADALEVDLGRSDLGLPDHCSFSMIVPTVRDLTFKSLRFAQTRQIPYIALSDAAFELGPVVAMFAHRPTASALLLLGHSHGGIPSIVTAAVAREFKEIAAVAIGLVFDPDDPFGPGSQADMERIMRAGPPPLARVGGAWRWLDKQAAVRSLRSSQGGELAAEAVGLTDALGLSGAIGAASIRLDAASGRTARGPDGAIAHEVIIEIAGEHLEHGPGRYRWELVDPEGNVMLGARGVALAAERLLGLDGSTPPGPGLYFPEQLLDGQAVLDRLRTMGVRLSVPLPA